MKRAVIYCRLSDEDRDKQQSDESESIQNQKSMLTAYAKAQGWEIAGIFCDEDYSGSDRSRPDFLRMLRLCEAGGADVVLCKTQSRFSRDIEVVEHFIHGKFPEWGVRFVGVVDNADTEIAGNKKQRQVNALVNEWYLEDLSGNIRKTLRHKNSEGKSTAPFPPYGYKTDPADKNRFVVDEPAAENVRSIFTMYAGGFGYGKIAQTLNKREIPSPTAYKQKTGAYRNINGENSAAYGKWTAATVCRIIGNEVYIGNLVQHKTEKISYRGKKRRTVPEPERIRCPGTHEAVIPPELWEKAQLQREARTRSEKYGGCVNLFSGLVRCGECGGRMAKISYRSGKSRYRYYSCHMRSLKLCGNMNIREELLEGAALPELNRLLAESFDAALISAGAQRKTALEKELAAVRRQAELKRLATERLYADRLAGIISAELFKRFDKTNAESEKRLCEAEKSLLAELEAASGEDYEKYRRAAALTRRLTSGFIEKIEVGGGKPREIKIHWKV